jgi:predicted nucleic acid-binding Zn ribbon protein
MKIEELKKELETGNRIYRGSCHDCSKQVEVTATLREDGAIVIGGNGSVYKVKDGQDFKYFFKCEECFKGEPILRNFRDCLVYSRVVGYLRPVSGWNKGKLAEWNVRKEFTNTKE